MARIRIMPIGLVTAGLLASMSMAEAVPFSITSAAFYPESGYGKDACESYGQLLDVRFNTSMFSTQNFTLDAEGDSYSFNVGTVNLKESDWHGGIRSSETDSLGVTAALIFGNPVGTTLNVLATGTAYIGQISDGKVDYTLAWNPVFVDFGLEGQFEVAFDTLLFGGTGPQVQKATVTLWSTDAQVPEPGTMILAGLGLAGLGFLRRRRAA